MQKKWELIHKLSGTSKKEKNVSKITIGNITHTNDFDIANKLNIYFHSIATELDSQLVQNEISPYGVCYQKLEP